MVLYFINSSQSGIFSALSIPNRQNTPSSRIHWKILYNFIIIYTNKFNNVMRKIYVVYKITCLKNNAVKYGITHYNAYFMFSKIYGSPI